MNLASVGGGGSIDNGVLMGMGKSYSEKDLKWEPPKQYAQEPELPPARLPPWLEDFGGSALKDVSLQRLQADGNSTGAGSGTLSEKVDLRKPSLESELRASSTIDEIRKALFHHSTAMTLNKAQSALGFLRLLESGSLLPELLEYLDDKKLNDPAARNLAILTAWRGLEKLPAEIDLLESWIERGIALGTLSERDIQSLVSGISLSIRNWSIGEHAPMRAWSIYKTIWTGIQASDSNGISKLGADTVGALLEVACRSPVRGEGQRIGMKILKVRHNLVDLLSNVSDFAIHLSELPSPRRPKGMVDPDKERAFSWFYPLLAQIPQKDASAIIANLSGKLTRRLSNAERDSNIWVQEWFGTLDPEAFQVAKKDSEWAEKWWHIDQSLASSTRPGSYMTLAAYLQLFETKERYLFLLHYWIPPRWPRGKNIETFVFSEASADTSSWKEFIRNVELNPYFPGIHPDTMLLDIMKLLQETYPVVFHTILPDLLSLLRHLGQSSVIPLIARYCKDRHIKTEHAVWAVAVSAHVKTNPALAHEIFQLDTRLRLEDCPGLAETIIADPSLGNIYIFQLLKRQPGIIGSVPLTTHPEKPLSITSERVSLLHKMALAFADSPHMNPRQAYRKVIRIARYFRDRPDLLRPEMSKALATAGILRYLEAGMWVTPCKLNYILGMVRGLEGEAVAQELDRVVFEWQSKNAETAHASMGREEVKRMVRDVNGTSIDTATLPAGRVDNAQVASVSDGVEERGDKKPVSASGRGFLFRRSERWLQGRQHIVYAPTRDHIFPSPKPKVSRLSHPVVRKGAVT